MSGPAPRPLPCPLPRLGLGSAPLGGLFAPVDHDDGVAAVRAAVEAGYRYIDTAPLYGYGAAERIVGDGLVSANGVVVSTKVGRTLLPGARRDPEDLYKGADRASARFDFSRDAVRRSLDASLARLGRSDVDLVFIHDPDDHLEAAISETYPALEELKAAGVVGAVGVGTNRAEVGARFVRETGIDAVLIAGRYTLLDQSAADDLLPAALDRGVDVIAAGVYNSGVLSPTDLPRTYDYRPAGPSVMARVERLGRICARHGVPLAAAALQFPLRHRAVATVLVGARTAGESIQNLEFSQVAASDGLWEEIDELHAGRGGVGEAGP